MTDHTPDIETIKARQKATWMAGDFGQIAKSVDSHAKDFIARRTLRPGMRVLDVACGTGNAALHAARAGADVTGVDIAGDLRTDGIAPGLEAIATGFGVLFPDDESNLEVQFYVYDARYAWCRLQAVRESAN